MVLKCRTFFPKNVTFLAGVRVWKMNEEQIVHTYADMVYKIAYRYFED